MTEPARKMSSVLRAAMPPADRLAVLAFYDNVCWERETGGVAARAIVSLMQSGKVVEIPERYWTHVCCRCQGRGAVIPRNRAGTVLPIDWKCRGCEKFVCHNCTLTVPGSVPLRFREDTLCSEECWRKIGAPREEEEQTADSGQRTAPETDDSEPRAQ